MRALCDFAVALTHQPASLGEEHIARLREHGWSDAAIHDAVQVVSYFNYVNRVAEGVGVDDEPEWAE